MRAFVEDSCVCCGLCEGICGEVFSLETGISVAGEVIPGTEDAVREACDSCPVGAIKIEE